MEYFLLELQILLQMNIKTVFYIYFLYRVKNLQITFWSSWNACNYYPLRNYYQEEARFYGIYYEIILLICQSIGHI